MSEERETQFALDGADHCTGHVGSFRYFCCWDPYLAAKLISVFDGCAVGYAIEACPEDGCHAHGTGLAGGVEGITLEGEAFELFTRKTNCANLSVRAWIIFFADSIRGAHQAFAGPAMEDVRPEGHWMLGLQ
jgi:hypothetical protein